VTIASDGSFSFVLTSPPDNLFRKFETDSSCLSVVQIQPPNAQWIFLQLNVQADTGKFGEISRSSDSLEFYWGQTKGYYSYFNTNGTMSGLDSCIDTLTTSVRKYNVTFPSRTWFSLYAKFEQITSTHFQILVSSQLTEQLKWYFIRRED
jgi:hypothetical protein